MDAEEHTCCPVRLLGNQPPDIRVRSGVDNEQAVHAVAREVDVSAILRGGDRALAAAGDDDPFDNGLCFDIDGEHEFGKDLPDEEFAVCTCHLTRWVLTDRPAAD